MLVGTLVLGACGSDDDGSEAAAITNDTTPADSTAPDGGMITVYTGRHYGIEPVFEQFTADTGIEVRFTTGNDPELRERLIAEGANTPADVVMTADAANIELSAEAGILSSVDSDILVDTIPEDLRSENNDWFSLSQRARVIVASTERVENPPTTYAGVGDPEWQGKLCLRPSTHPYTQSLVASLVIAEGEERAHRDRPVVGRQRPALHQQRHRHLQGGRRRRVRHRARQHLLPRSAAHRGPHVPGRDRLARAGRPWRPRQRQHRSGHCERPEPGGRRWR